MTLEGTATADMHASRDGYTMLTGRPADAMHPEAADVVYLIDHHRNVMLVYGLSTKSNDAQPQSQPAPRALMLER